MLIYKTVYSYIGLRIQLQECVTLINGLPLNEPQLKLLNQLYSTSIHILLGLGQNELTSWVDYVFFLLVFKIILKKKSFVYSITKMRMVFD